MKKLLLVCILVVLTACSKDAPSPRLTKFNYTAHAGEYVPFEGENLDNETWVSKYPFVASVTNNYMIANKVGKAEILNDQWTVYLTVKPRYSIFEKVANEQILSIPFGSHLGDVQDYMRFCDCGAPNYYNNYKYVGYQLYDNIAGAVVFCIGSDNKMEYYALSVNPTKSDLLKKWLDERYTTIPPELGYSEAYAHYKKNGTPDMVVYISRDSSSITVMFMPVAVKSGSNTIIEEINKIFRNY